MYGLFAVGVAGAASAPMFVVQRLSHGAQGEHGAAPPGSAGGEAKAVLLTHPLAAPASDEARRSAAATEASAAALTSAPDGASPPAVLSDTAAGPLAARPAKPATARAPVRPRAIRRDVAGRAFKPAPVAAWLPDPASYVARNSQAHRGAGLPATTAPARLAAGMPGSQPSSQSLAEKLLHPAAGQEDGLESSASAAALVQAPPQEPAPIPQAVQADAPVPEASGQPEAGGQEPALAAAGQDSLLPDIAEDDASATVVVAAAQTSVDVSAGTSVAVDAVPLPAAPHAQLLHSTDEEVVVVAQASPQLRQAPQPQPLLWQTREGDAVVVAARSSASEEAGVQAQLGGMSLALSTSLSASSVRLARGVELPGWAVMGKDNKLRLAR